MKKELIGMYENATVENAKQITEDIGNFEAKQQHKKNIDEGYQLIGVIDKNTNREEEAQMLAKATLNREPSAEEIASMLKAMDDADKK